MNFAILTSPNSWYLRDLERAAHTRHRIQAISFTQLNARLVAGDCRVESNAARLEDFDAVLVRTMPPGSLEQVVFRMDLLARLVSSGTGVFNSPRAIEVAVDKFLALAKLEAAGLPIPPTFICQTAEDAMGGFEELGGDVVVKPLFGGEGRGMVRVSDRGIGWRTFKTLAQLNCVLYLQQFIEHAGFDIRLFVLGDEVLAMRRSNANDWRTNISLGATAALHQPDEAEIQLARSAARTIGASIAGVDLLPGRDGRKYVLEVNAVPGWKALAQTLEIDVAARVLDHLVMQVRAAKER